MFYKKVKHKKAELDVVKSAKTGEISVGFTSLCRGLGFKYDQIKYFRKKATNHGLLDQLKLRTKGGLQSAYVVGLDDIKDLFKIINPKDETQQERIKDLNKTIKSNVKRSMAKMIPTDIAHMLETNTFRSHFKRVKESAFTGEYTRVIDNLIKLKSQEKLGIRKNIKSALEFKHKKQIFNSYEQTKFMIERDILKDKIIIERSKQRKANKSLKGLSQTARDLINKTKELENEVKELRPEYHFVMDSKYIYSYNHAIKAVKGRIVTPVHYKLWKTQMKQRFKDEGIRDKYLTNGVITTAHISPKKILMDLKIRVHVNSPLKTPDGDNYLKTFQDALSESLGINDSKIRINNFEMVMVNSYAEQGYEFGLRIEK